MGTTLTVDLLLSVDGWAGSDGLPGFFGYLGPDIEEWIASEAASPHRVVMGRKTYELLANLPDEARDEGGGQMDQMDAVVFSRTLNHLAWPNARLCARDAVEEVRGMKLGDDLPLRTMGSLSLVRQLMGADLVDRLRLMTFPLLAGEFGREAAFGSVSSADLELIDHRVLDRRVLLLEYRPTGKPIPRA